MLIFHPWGNVLLESVVGINLGSIAKLVLQEGGKESTLSLP